MRAARLDTFAWVLIYGGLLVLCLGVFVSQYAGDGEVLGTALCIAGGVAAALGTLFIYLRSRIPDRPAQKGSRP